MRQRLHIDLELTLGERAHTIPGGDVRAFGLEMTGYGVTGSVTFIQQDDQSLGGSYKDEVLADFVKPDLSMITLGLRGYHSDASAGEELPAISTRGLILDKSVDEQVIERIPDEPALLYRTYTVRFADPARALWSQHFPCDLFTQKTFKDVIEAHKGDKISVTYDWDALTEARPLTFFHLDPARGASFYDFVLWWVRHHRGVWTYDHREGTYTLAGEKDGGGEAAELLRADLSRVTSVFPPVRRAKARVLNSFTESVAREVIEDERAATGIFRDHLIRTPLAQEVDARVALETDRATAPEPGVTLELERYPTVAITPGSLVRLSSKGGFSEDLIPSSQDLRVWRLEVDGRARDGAPDQDYGEAEAGFDLTCSARLETQDDATPRFPELAEPSDPGYLEGTIVSEIGEDDESTYQIYQDEETSLDLYHVKIPLFDDQIVTAPFEPALDSGTVYLPASKGARVLVELGLDSARLVRLLDWRPGARVPLDGQGEHLLLGKTGESSTSILHDYQEGKPVFRLLRTNEKDTALIRIEEGRMTLRVEEQKGG